MYLFGVDRKHGEGFALAISSGDLSAWVIAAGALGGAAFGIVEGLKLTPLGTIGFPVFRKHLGAIWDSLDVAYGANFRQMLEALYRGEREELVRTLRQGVRLSLTSENAEAHVRVLGVGVIDADTLAKAAGKIRAGDELTDAERNVLARYEVAVDARIDGAATLALNHYTNGLRIWAMVIALGIALLVAYFGSLPMNYAFIVGFAAVPLAPIAKDLSTAIQAAGQALRNRP